MHHIVTVGVLSLLVNLATSTGVRAQERMPPVPVEKMTDAQKKAVADYKTLRGVDMTAPPWTVLLRVPAHIVPALQIRLHYLNSSALPARLTEFAILIAARRWTNNWEWNAHSTAAAAAGLKPDVMAAVAEGRRPDRMADDEAVVYDFSLELQDNQSVSDATYARALEKFGEPGIVEMASIQGYYTYLAMVMSAARVTTQPDAKPALERFPGSDRAGGKVEKGPFSWK
jgi:4-carboxymuconolactone decarboxylase